VKKHNIVVLEGIAVHFDACAKRKEPFTLSVMAPSL